MCAPAKDCTNGGSDKHKQRAVFAAGAEDSAYYINGGGQVRRVELVGGIEFKKIF